MKPYSLDLREKIVAVYDQGEISQRQLAKQFQVATSFVQKLLKQRRDLGSLAPRVRQEQTQPKLGEEHCQVLKDLVEQNNDATLEELATLLYERVDILVGKSTIDRTLKRLGMTRKKNANSERQRNGKSPSRTI
jgi:transposase